MSFTAEQARGYSDMDPIYGEIKKRVEEKKRGDVSSDVLFSSLTNDQVKQLKKDGYKLTNYSETEYTTGKEWLVSW